MNAWEWAEAEKAAKLAVKAGTVVAKEATHIAEAGVAKAEKDHLGSKLVEGLKEAATAVEHAVEHVIHPHAGAAQPAPAEAPAAAPQSPQPGATGSNDRKAQLLAELHQLEGEVEKM